MLLRLVNVLASLQGYIKKILAGILNVFVIIYINNILIYINKESYIDSL